MASGSISKRQGKRGTTYQVVINLGTDAQGKRRQLKRSFKTRKEAEHFRTKTLHELNSGTYVTPTTMLLDTYFEHWLATIDVRATSRVRYTSIYRNRIAPTFGAVPLGRIQTRDIQAWANDLRRQYKSASQMVTVLHSILEQAVRELLIPRNPCSGVTTRTERSAPASSESKAWTPQQLAAFLDGSREHPDWAAWWVAAHTGLRPGELVALRWNDIDLQERTLRVDGTQTVINAAGTRVIGEHAKNSASERTIGLDPETVLVLTGQRAAQNARRLVLGPRWVDEGIVFDTGDGSPHHAERMNRRFVTRGRQLGLPRITLHGLRHTHGSILAMSGRPLHYIQHRLGHATLSTTARHYLHLMPGTEHVDAEAFAAVIRQAREG